MGNNATLEQIVIRMGAQGWESPLFQLWHLVADQSPLVSSRLALQRHASQARPLLFLRLRPSRYTHPPLLQLIYLQYWRFPAADMTASSQLT